MVMPGEVSSESILGRILGGAAKVSVGCHRGVRKAPAPRDAGAGQPSRVPCRGKVGKAEYPAGRSLTPRR